MVRGESVLMELETIRQQNGGILKADAVVEFARDPETALHSRFCWDDTEAAHQYRLEQARKIIRVTVTILPKANKEYRAFVSLMEDRKETGGGYRATVDVLSDADKRARLIAQALAELNRIREQYQHLTELAPVFDAIEVATVKMKKAKHPKRTRKQAGYQEAS